jgi:hypothetical protein
MVLEKKLSIKSISPFEAGQYEVCLLGYFSTADLLLLFKRIDALDKVEASFKQFPKVSK